MNEQSAVPEHLGLILDGNRRWAKANGVTTAEGHRAGYENLKTIARAAMDQGVSYISAYVFSSENWQRDEKEVSDIMGILSWVLKHEVKQLHKDNIRVRFIGSRSLLKAGVVSAMEKAEELTQGNDRGTILLCLDYGGQQEIVDAVKRISAQNIPADEITADTIAQNLYAPDVPAPDLIIRTSGEQRLSNFMSWQSSYSELMFNPKFWPDFSEADLLESFERYSQLQRRFGK